MHSFWQQIVNPSGSARRWLTAAAIALIPAIGYLDYRTGYEASWLIFYFLPVCLAVTARGWRFGALAAIASVATWLAGDFAAGVHYDNPMLPAWNVLIALGSYLVVVTLFSNLLAMHREMETRVRRRPALLIKSVAERGRLERLIPQIGERERRSLGHELHYGLGLHLTGTSLAGQVLVEKLQAREAGETEDARNLVERIESAIEQTRRLSEARVLAGIG